MWTRRIASARGARISLDAAYGLVPNTSVEELPTLIVAAIACELPDMRTVVESFRVRSKSPTGSSFHSWFALIPWTPASSRRSSSPTQRLRPGAGPPRLSRWTVGPQPGRRPGLTWDSAGCAVVACPSLHSGKGRGIMAWLSFVILALVFVYTSVGGAPGLAAVQAHRQRENQAVLLHEMGHRHLARARPRCARRHLDIGKARPSPGAAPARRPAIQPDSSARIR
jgi:hypothetical protein